MSDNTQAQEALEGWRLVPVEPTVRMCIAGDEARQNVDDMTRTPAIYRAMLATAPQPPSAQQVNSAMLQDQSRGLSQWLASQPDARLHAREAAGAIVSGRTVKDSLTAAAQHGGPVAYLWQHSETGRTRVVMPDQVVTVDASWHVVGPLVLATRPTAEPFGWMVTGGTTIYTGEYAEVDARCEAIHCGGTAEAIPLYRHAAAAPGPVRQALSDERITTMRQAGYLDADDYPDAWAYERGVRDAERAHGIEAGNEQSNG